MYHDHCCVVGIYPLFHRTDQIYVCMLTVCNVCPNKICNMWYAVCTFLNICGFVLDLLVHSYSMQFGSLYSIKLGIDGEGWLRLIVVKWNSGASFYYLYVNICYKIYIDKTMAVKTTMLRG